MRRAPRCSGVRAAACVAAAALPLLLAAPACGRDEAKGGQVRVHVWYLSGSGNYQIEIRLNGYVWSSSYESGNRDFYVDVWDGDFVEAWVWPDGTVDYDVELYSDGSYVAGSYNGTGAADYASFEYVEDEAARVRVSIYNWWTSGSVDLRVYLNGDYSTPVLSETRSGTGSHDFYVDVSEGDWLSVEAVPQSGANWELEIYSPRGDFMAGSYNGTGQREYCWYAYEGEEMDEGGPPLVYVCGAGRAAGLPAALALLAVALLLARRRLARTR